MSRQLALDTILLQPTARLAHTEYSLGYHKEYIRQRTGLDSSDPNAIRRLESDWLIDFHFGVNDGLRGSWAQFGRSTDMGHAEYAADGSDLRRPAHCPFETLEEVWAFDAIEEYGLPDFDEQVAAYEKSFQAQNAACPEQLHTGGYYKTIVSGAIQAFGWDMLLMAASEPAKMEPVFDSFFRRTLFHMKAWAQTSAEVMIQHDDFVWTQGAFMHPDIYRDVIIPRYAELWKPLREAGKTVLFCSDGTFTEFAEDILAAGASGFIFEPSNDFGYMVETFGGTACLVGSFVDCRDMAFRPWDVVKASMDRTFELADRCEGLIFAVGNHMPANIPPEIMDSYIEYFKANCGRK